MTTVRAILKNALPLIPKHGFTRECLSLAALKLPSSPELPDAGVSALFGNGDESRKALIRAWLKEGLETMAKSDSPSQQPGSHSSLRTLLARRLEYNEPVLKYLPDAFALLASSPTPTLLDPRPAITHNISIADEALHLSGDISTGMRWYSRRMALPLVYGSSELHQLRSPETALAFLEDNIERLKSLEEAEGSVQEFAGFVFNGWKGIIKSRGLL
ncbi:hypothetical protein FRC03_010714 [Tulasnella sp. 419]|nr:hypothetical protein FRC03_010714 [Tulasnella sp. 419]